MTGSGEISFLTWKSCFHQVCEFSKNFNKSERCLGAGYPTVLWTFWIYWWGQKMGPKAGYKWDRAGYLFPAGLSLMSKTFQSRNGSEECQVMFENVFNTNDRFSVRGSSRPFSESANKLIIYSHTLSSRKNRFHHFLWCRKRSSWFRSEKTSKFWEWLSDRSISKSLKFFSQETAQKNEERCFSTFISRTIVFPVMSRQDLFGRAQKTLSFTHSFSRHKN